MTWGYALDDYFKQFTELELFRMKVVAWGVAMSIAALWIPRKKE